MLIVSTAGIIVLGIKAGVAIISVVALASSVLWFHNKTFKGNKKGADRLEDNVGSERFNRHDI